MGCFEYKNTFPVSREQLFGWHTRPGAFERLTPPWVRLKSVQGTGSIDEGSRVQLVAKEGLLTTRWLVRHGRYEEGYFFSDIQEKGPFRSWLHEHRFRDASSNTSILEDVIDYTLPLAALGQLLGGALVRKKLQSLFRYRHELLRLDLERFQEVKPQRILVSGGTGLIGRALIPLLKTQGHAVTVLSRTPGEGRIVWDPSSGALNPFALEGFDAVYHLAGESIMGRWTASKKARIYKSRVLGTKLLCETLAALDQKPRVLVSVSGISASLGRGFLAEVGANWERATGSAHAAGIRVFQPRVSVVLSPAGGALKAMLPAFKCGLGGRIGTGSQRMSWIAIDDLVDILYSALLDDAYEGPLDILAPEVLTNRAFTKKLAKHLHRPAILPVPEAVMKLLLGDVAEETVLADVAGSSEGLEKCGYTFRYPTLEKALGHLLP